MIKRWELIQAQSLSEKHRQKQNLQQWQQLISDLQTMRAWLGQSEAELSQLRGLDLSTDIHTIQQRIKKLKVCLPMLKIVCFFTKCRFICRLQSHHHRIITSSVCAHFSSLLQTLYSVLLGSAHEVQFVCSNLPPHTTSCPTSH